MAGRTTIICEFQTNFRTLLMVLDLQVGIYLFSALWDECT